MTQNSNSGSLPAYIKISEVIARRINAGQILAGDRLPNERTMAVEFGVAVGPCAKLCIIYKFEVLLHESMVLVTILINLQRPQTFTRFLGLNPLLGLGFQPPGLFP